MSRKALPALVVTLLLANGVLFAAQRGLFGPDPLSGWGETRREPQRAQQEMGAERLKLVALRAPGVKAGAPAPEKLPETVADDVAEKVAEKTAEKAAEQDNPPPTLADKAPDKLPGATRPVCMEIGGFSPQAVRQVVSALAADKAFEVEQFERQDQVRWWIHLQPQATREDADRKLAELRRRNVKDYAIVPADGYTISLGVFKERERAEQYLATLRDQGVRTAVLSDMPHGAARQWLRVREARETKSAQPVAHEGEARTLLERLRRRYGGDEVVPCRA